jgi:hypothetical protein
MLKWFKKHNDSKVEPYSAHLISVAYKMNAELHIGCYVTECDSPVEALLEVRAKNPGMKAITFIGWTAITKYEETLYRRNEALLKSNRESPSDMGMMQ